MCMYMDSVWVSAEARQGHQSMELDFQTVGELPYVGAGNQTQALCRSSVTC